MFKGRTDDRNRSYPNMFEYKRLTEVGWVRDIRTSDLLVNEDIYLNEMNYASVGIS